MERDELREILLDLFPNDAEYVDSFLGRVDKTNDVAITRIARSIGVTTEEVVETTEETDVEEVTETTEEEEVVEEEVVEEVVETTEESDEAQVVLDESFIPDLVSSPEFRAAIDLTVKRYIATLEQKVAELQSRFETEVREVLEDVPARTKTVRYSYRAQKPDTSQADSAVSNRSFEAVAKDSLDEIFG